MRRWRAMCKGLANDALRDPARVCRPYTMRAASLAHTCPPSRALSPRPSTAAPFFTPSTMHASHTHTHTQRRVCSVHTTPLPRQVRAQASPHRGTSRAAGGRDRSTRLSSERESGLAAWPRGQAVWNHYQAGPRGEWTCFLSLRSQGVKHTRRDSQICIHSRVIAKFFYSLNGAHRVFCPQIQVCVCAW